MHIKQNSRSMSVTGFKLDYQLVFATNTACTSNVSINITIPELSTLFDGTEQLIGLADRPFYTRETFKP